MKRILLIEDDSGAQLLYRNRLTDLGYEVVVSPTGAMGVVEARAASFDLFLVDIELGSGIDGYEVCRRLKTIPGIHSVPVVLISGRVKAQEDLHRGYEAGCQSFLVKGDLMLLEDIVRAMLRIKSLQDDLALQNRLLEERNRRFELEQARNADLSMALSSRKGAGSSEPGRPDGILLVDGEGVVRSSDRGARELLGLVADGKHLATLAPDSRLEAIVRNVRSEPHEALRFEIPERAGRMARQLVASVHPFVPHPERAEPILRLVLLNDAERQRSVGGVPRHEESPALRREWAPLVEVAREAFRPSALLGSSAAVQELRARVAELARSDEPILLRGPSGSGKAFVARILHYSSLRAGPFVALACGAFGERELEAELFGGGKEAGAGVPDGALRTAQGGTLLLQDVERLSAPLQERLLEVLSAGRLPRSGPLASERVEVRVLAATRADLAQVAEQGAFSPALAQRLAMHTLVLPPLSARRADFASLSQLFLARHGRFDGACLATDAAWVLEQYTWSENVRGLERALQEACEAARGPEVQLDDLPQALLDWHRLASQGGARPPSARPRGSAPALEQVLDELLASLSSTVPLLEAYERLALLHALRQTKGDKLAAARLLQVGKSTFYRKLKEHGIG